MSLAFLPFSPAIVDPLVLMWRECFETSLGIVDPHPLAAQRAYLIERILPFHAVVLAMEADRLVGFCASNAESVNQLHVRVGCQGRGIGTLLLQRAQADSAGSLWLYTYARNVKARRFYERHQFKPVAFGFEPVWQMDDVRYEWER